MLAIEIIAGFDRTGECKSCSKAAGIDSGERTALAGTTDSAVATASTAINIRERIYLSAPHRCDKNICNC